MQLKAINMANTNYEYLDSFLDAQRRQGRFTFTTDQVIAEFQLTENAFKKAAQRLLDQNRIARLRKRFYLIIPPEFTARKTLPLGYFVDDLMQFLERDYYVGLLTAAMYHGAAHQQPQSQFVVHEPSSLRPVENEEQTIIFCLKKEWSSDDIEQHKTDAGYINISNPALTAFDLVFYVDRVGGFNRAATVLKELTSQIDTESIKKAAFHFQQTTTLQRLGYLLEKILERTELADALYAALSERSFYPTLLSTAAETDNQKAPNMWKVIPNIEVEPEI